MLPPRSKWQLVAGPFAQDLPVTPKLFVLSPNNKLLVTGGHWDNTFRVHSIEKGRLAFRVHHHNGTRTCPGFLSHTQHLSPTPPDIVTCMALDKAGAGEHFITGSRDTTCVIWKFGNYVSLSPLPTLLLIRPLLSPSGLIRASSADTVWPRLRGTVCVKAW